MATITWQHPAPAVNPFEAVAGDFTTYSVHLCEARDHAKEETVVLLGVFAPALETARSVLRVSARFFLCDFDPVYSTLTLVVTDGDRERDEHHVYKVIFHDWDSAMLGTSIPDSEYDSACKEAERRMYDLIDAVLRREELSALVEELKRRGFEFWFTNADPEGEREHLDV